MTLFSATTQMTLFTAHYPLFTIKINGLAQDLGGVQRLFTGAVFDLVAATGTGGNDNGIIGGGTDFREEATLAHLDGDMVVFGFVTESAGHAAAA